MEHICKQCGMTFKRPGLREAKYCSQECYSQSRIKPPVICIDCGETKKHYARGRCAECHRSWYNSQPKRKEIHARQMREWRRDNPDAAAAIEARRSETTKRKAWKHKYYKKYYAVNAEQLRQYQRDWRKNNPEQRDEYKRQYRARKAELPSTLTPEEWDGVLYNYNYCCAYCGSDGPLDKEHWVPASRGGGYTKDNIVPACGICNSRKGTMTGEEFHQQLDIEEWDIIKGLIECAY